MYPSQIYTAYKSTATKYDTSSKVIRDIDIYCSVDIDGSRVSCQRCQSSNLKLGAGKGPHHASLICLSCNRHIRWLSRAQTETLSSRFKAQQQVSQLSLFEGGEV